MNYHNITKCDLKNGEGLRVVLWLSHCEHYCKNCHNKQTWDKNSGIQFDDVAKLELFKELEESYTTGITLSGGDPLSTINRYEILSLSKEIKTKYPNKTIWCYTGYLWEDIKSLPGIENIDVLIDGKFIDSLSKPSPKWRGSANQRIIDVKNTLKKGYLHLYDN